MVYCSFAGSFHHPSGWADCGADANLDRYSISPPKRERLFAFHQTRDVRAQNRSPRSSSSLAANSSQSTFSKDHTGKPYQAATHTWSGEIIGKLAQQVNDRQDSVRKEGRKERGNHSLSDTQSICTDEREEGTKRKTLKMSRRKHHIVDRWWRGDVWAL